MISYTISWKQTVFHLGKTVFQRVMGEEQGQAKQKGVGAEGSNSIWGKKNPLVLLLFLLLK